MSFHVISLRQKRYTLNSYKFRFNCNTLNPLNIIRLNCARPIMKPITTHWRNLINEMPNTSAAENINLSIHMQTYVTGALRISWGRVEELKSPTFSDTYFMNDLQWILTIHFTEEGLNQIFKIHK